MMQRTTQGGLNRVGSGRALGNRNNTNGFHLSGLSYDGKIAGLYDLEETLGRGHFAVVKLARHVFTGEKVAVKVIDKTKLDEVSRSHLFQEVRCMKLVQHPNVVRLYEVIDTQTKLYLILELGDGGDLYDYIMRHDNGLDQESARHYFRQVVHAISYCHQLHVVHRDLKPENVVFFEKLGMVKLTDFGFSNKYDPGQKLETSCGSLAYSAPEILLGDSYDAPAVDIWSLGVILYMLVCGHPPFQEANDSETLTMIMDCKYKVPPHVSEGCRRLISRMLQRDPADRANLEEIANDPWLQEGASAAMVQPATYLPLVSREHLSEEDHALILQKMVNGGIAAKEEILDALDKDEYNNITATYFLLAERKLRAQRQEQAMIVNRGQTAVPSTPKELEEGMLPVKAAIPQAALMYRAMVESACLQGSGAPLIGNRPRKYSAVDEEDESTSVGGGGAGSGSESSRRSQRSSNNSLASQRTSNTSLASQRASNNSLAGSLRARGLLNSSTLATPLGSAPIAIPSSTPSSTTPSAIRSADLRLELIAEITPSYSPKQEHFLSRVPDHSISGEGLAGSPINPSMEVPAPFPTTSNIGLGLRSPRASPITSPVTGHRILPQQQLTGSGRTTPGSISPASPSTPSSPGSSPTVNSKGGRTTLPSPSRVLHAVRSSPQLILNEIFEEAESDSEISSAMGTKSPCGFRYRRNGNPPPPPPPKRPGCRAVSAGPSAASQVSSQAAMQRRYEQRRTLAKNRTASCSSSDASDNDDSEVRKKRAEKIHSSGKGRAFPSARRDSHDDSSDPGGEGPNRGGKDGDGAGTSSAGGSSSVREQDGQSGSDSQNSSGSREQNKGGNSSGGRSQQLQAELDCIRIILPGEEDPKLGEPGGRSHRFRHHHHKGRRYTNAACNFSLLSPGLGSETHLRASQSLSCLTEVCDEGPHSSDSPRIVVDSLDVPDGAGSSRPIPTRSCSNLEKIEEGSAASGCSGLDSSSQELDFRLLLPTSPRMLLGTRVCKKEEFEESLMETVPDDEGFTPLVPTNLPENSWTDGGSPVKVQPADSTSGSKKQKRLKQLFSRREGTNSSFKKSDKRWARKKSRGKSTSSHGFTKEESSVTSDVSCELASGDSSKIPADSDATAASSSSGRTMSFFRSRLYKAKSLGSLVKERILVEASHCQYELWKRFGRTPGVKTGDVNMNGPSTALHMPVPATNPKSGPPVVDSAEQLPAPQQTQPQQCCSVSTATVLDSTC